MNVLVLGGGGREHALCLKLAERHRVFAAPGNPGIAQCARLLPVETDDFHAVCEACVANAIELVVVGPEKPLITGIADYLTESGIAVYGPRKQCARIEGSKAFAKKVMQDLGIPTADAQIFTEIGAAEEYIKSKYSSGCKLVIKASGDAFGKGALVCENMDEAKRAAEAMLVDKALGEAGLMVVIEDKLEGEEVSLMAICNGRDYLMQPSARDYKTADDGGAGPNTGGMGAVSPAPNLADSRVRELGETFVAPVLRFFEKSGTPFRGTLFPGLMLTSDGPKVLEYNARFGDPETQAVLLRMDGDLGKLLWNAANGEDMSMPSYRDVTAAVVVIAAKGYPGRHDKGIPLPNLELKDVSVLHAGTALNHGQLVSNGGRVLNLCATGERVSDARERIYGQIHRFDGGEWHYRKDIGQ